MKSHRQAAILRLIQEQDIASQSELTQALAGIGIKAAQSTVSRDMRELGLVLERFPEGLKYVATTQRILNILLRDSLVSVACAGHMLVLRTRSGMAMAVALALDEMELDEILGSVAGDDTVICVVKTQAQAEALKIRLEGQGIL